MEASTLLIALLLIHVGGAVVGFGPTLAFAVLGPMAAKAGPQGGVAIMEGMIAIEKKLVLPVAAVTQPLSGLALIFVAGYGADFFRHTWLWLSIAIYAVAFYLAILVQAPTLERMIHIAKAGPPTPEFAAAAKRTQRIGPVVTVMVLVIIFLMVVKPVI